MVQLADKLGFLEEESLRTQCIVRGREYDSLVFGVVREDWWKAQRPKGCPPLAS
jgi:RimJ/RimL family protein N-acetyltransferase